MEYRFTKRVLLRVFKDFLDRLEHDHGCNRKEQIAYHINRLVGLTLPEVLRTMPRGPRGRWQDMMQDIRADLTSRASKRTSPSP